MNKRKKLLAAGLGVLAMVLAAVVILGRQGVAVETAAVKERHIAQAILANGHFTAQSEQELVGS